MQPDNPIVGGVILRRPAIQSPNYVAGTTGWAIFADGTAEFNNVTVRGNAVVNGTDGSFVELTTQAGAAVLELSPATTSTTWSSPGLMYANAVTGGAGDIIIQSPTPSPGGISVGTILIRSNDSLNHGSLVQLAAPGTNGQVDLEANGTSGSILMNAINISINAGATLTLTGATIAATSIVGIVSNAAETWHTPTLINNFTQATPALQYRMLASPPNTVQLYGWITSGATTASGTAICQLPAGYRPAVNTLPHEANNAGPGTTLWLGLQADGNVALHGSWTNGAAIQIDAFFPIDK